MQNISRAQRVTHITRCMDVRAGYSWDGRGMSTKDKGIVVTSLELRPALSNMY